MENLGSLTILLAFCLAVYAFRGSIVGGWKRKPFLILSAERAVYSVWFLLTVASVLLVYALHLRNPVFTLAFLPNSFVYLRNVVLVRRKRAQTK